MRSSTMLWVAIPMLTLYACSNTGSYDSSQTENTVFSDTTAGVSPELTESRKRIKTADIRCRVNDVLGATSGIERLVTSLNGIVEESELRNEQDSQIEYPWSADSLKRVTLYKPVANLTLRVPPQHLDSVVRTLTAMSAHISHRVVKDTDVTRHYLSNEMYNKAADAPTRNTTHTKQEKELDISRYEDAKQAQAIDRTIINMGIDEAVAYSTLTVELYQPEVASVQVVFNPERLSRAPLGMAAVTSLRGGVEFMRAMLLFLLRVWPAFVLGACIWFAYKKFAAVKR